MKYFIHLFTFMLLSVSFAAHAEQFCSIKTADKVYRPKVVNGLGVKDIILQSDCPQSIQQKFTNIVLSSKGSFNSKTLRNNFKGYQVDITPKKIRVFVLNQKLKDFFGQSKNWHWRELSGLNKKQAFLLSSQEQMSFHCSNCRFTGEKRVQVDINNPIEGKVKRHWLKSKVVVSTEALVAASNQTVNNQGIRPNSFVKTKVDTIHPEKLFTNKDKLIFYKLNKPIQQGKALEYTDIAPVNLVQQGKAAKIVYDHRSISLSGVAIPIRSGKIGDTVQLRHPKTRKVILGKVIDFNKVMVDL